MAKRPEPDAHDPRLKVLTVTMQLLEESGYQDVRLQAVARRAGVSTKTIYQLFSGRDDLIVSALELWMAEHSYQEVTEVRPDESLADLLVRAIRAVFEPWARQPRMLEAFFLARGTSEGERLREQGTQFATTLAEGFAGYDDDFLRDVREILLLQIVGAVALFTQGAITAEEIVPILERTIYRLTGRAPDLSV